MTSMCLLISRFLFKTHLSVHSAIKYMLQVYNTNIERCEICSKLITEAPKRQRSHSGILLLTLNVFLTFY